MSSKLKTTDAKEDGNPTLVPKLRFPGFEKPWSYDPLSKTLKEHKIKNTAGRDVFSVSMEYGIVNQIELLGRSFSAADTSHYTIGRRFDVVYTKSPLKAFPFGVVKQCKFDGEVALSPLYGVFTPPNPHLGLMIEAYFESPNRSKDFLSPLCQKGAKNTLQITNTTFLSGRLPLPTQPTEQQKIAECLSSVDELIALHAQKLDAFKIHKKGLMQQLFPRAGETQPRLRFPEFQTPWKTGVIEQLASTVMGNAFRSTDFIESGTQVIRIGNLYQGELQLDRAPVYLSDIQTKENSRFIVNPLDLLMSMTGTVGKRDYGFIIQVPAGCKPLLLNQRVMKIAPKHNCNAGFLLQLLKDERLLDQLHSLPGGTKQANLSAQDVKQLKISYPHESEQQRIADCLTTLDDLIAAQTQKLKAHKTHKNGLMQQLFPVTEEV